MKVKVTLLQCQPTLPSSITDTGLVLAAASFRGTTVGQAVGDVTGFPLPVGFTLAEYRTSGIPHTTLASAGAVVRTRVHTSHKEKKKKKENITNI